jgi:hypothetical protein
MRHKKFRAYSIVEIAITLIIVSLFLALLSNTKHIINKFSYMAASQVGEEIRAMLWESDVSLHLDAISFDSLNIEMIEGKKKVSAWEDIKLSGFKHNFIQNNATIRPIYEEGVINNRPGVFFTNSNAGNLYLSDSQIYGRDLFGPGNNITYMIVVYLPDEETDKTRIFTWYQVYSGYASRILVNIGANIYFNYGNTCCYAHSSQNATLPQSDIKRPVLVTLSKNGCTMSINVNGVNIDNEYRCMGNDTSRSAPTSIGDGFSGYLGEMIIFKERLTQDKLESIEQALMRKWGINAR